MDIAPGGSGSALVIPPEEISRLTNVATRALCRAAQGCVGTGYELLSWGKMRARRLRDQGEPWGEALLSRWEQTCDSYTEAYGVPLT